MNNHEFTYIGDLSKWLCQNNIKIKISYNNLEKTFSVTTIHEGRRMSSIASDIDSAIASIRCLIDGYHLKYNY